MGIETRYVSQKSVWASDEEELVNDISGKLDRLGLINDHNYKREIRYAIAEELERYTILEDDTLPPTRKFWWRLLYTFIIIFQWLLWPYCFYRWLRTGSFRVNPKSKLGIAISKICLSIR